MHHFHVRVTLAALILPALLIATSMVPVRHASAQAPQPGIAIYDLATQSVTSDSWSLTADFAVAAGAWESVTVTNYGYCFAGPNDPRQGTAHAAGVYWYAELQQAPPASDGYSYSGDLKPGRGGNVTGRVTVTSNQDFSAPVTHIDVTLSGSDLSFSQGNSLKVCLLGSS